MKKKTRIALTIISIIFIVLLILVSIILFTRGTAVTGSTEVFCRKGEFTCCNEKIDSRNSIALPDPANSWQCPNDATRCVVTNVDQLAQNNPIFTGSQNCHVEKSWRTIWDSVFMCDDEKSYSWTPVSLNKGEYIYAKTFGQGGKKIQYEIYKQKLYFCGDAGCTVGVRIASDSCTFQTNQKVYNEDGTLKNSGGSTISYTVPQDNCLISFTGSRYVCGNKLESCTSNSDCTGHQFGNKECSQRTLQTYGCVSFGQNVGTEVFILPTQQAQSDYSYGKRCDIISAQSVQCCGDTDCGSNAFCDKATFTCKAQGQVQCSQDSDCGVSIQCDIQNKQLTQPKCSSGKCVYQNIQQVSCCFDSDCQQGWYCDNDYKCKEGANVKTACPFDCCEKEPDYFDRLCTTGQECCGDHTCAKTGECEVIPGKQCKPYIKLPDLLGGATILPNLSESCWSWFTKVKYAGIILLSLLTFIFSYLSFDKKLKKKKQRPLVWIFTILLTLGVALLLYFIFWIGVIISLLLLILYIIIKAVL